MERNFRSLRRAFIALAVFAAVGCSDDDSTERVLTDDDAGTNSTNNMNDADMAFGDDASNGTNNLVDMSDDMASTNNTNNTNNANNGGTCVPNHDGVITRAEVPLQAGLNAKFKVATDVEFDTAGEMVDGELVWDLAQAFAGDELTLVELRDPAAEWFADDFPDADYVARLSQRAENLGVFDIADDGLYLLGVVSPEDGFTSTNLEYDPAVPVLQFPIDAEASWSVEADVSGTALGVVSVYDESYTTSYAGEGTLKTPYGDFEVIRLRTELERTIGLLTTTVRTYAFVSECFGTVATITSEDNESEEEFTTAAEIRRLSN